MMHGQKNVKLLLKLFPTVINIRYFF